MEHGAAVDREEVLPVDLEFRAENIGSVGAGPVREESMTIMSSKIVA